MWESRSGVTVQWQQKNCCEWGKAKEKLEEMKRCNSFWLELEENLNHQVKVQPEVRIPVSIIKIQLEAKIKKKKKKGC